MNQHVISFSLAFSGIKYALRTQPNFIIHGLAATVALVLGFILHISYIEWLIILFTIVLVFCAEMINTSIESMTDLITIEYRKQAKIAKDVAAGMVLVCAMSSLLVAAVIFLPKLLG